MEGTTSSAASSAAGSASKDTTDTIVDSAESAATSSDGESSTVGQDYTVSDVLEDRTDDGTAVEKHVSASPQDTCTWYADSQCRQPRSCYDCLNELIRTDSCMIDEFGTCVSKSGYSTQYDFRRALPPNVQRVSLHQFPSETNVTYCERTDPYCMACREAWASPFPNPELAELPFCRGDGGCVCTRACELAYRSENIIMQRCVAYGMQAPTTKTIGATVGIMAGVCLVFALIALGVRLWVRRLNRRAAEAPPPPPSRSTRSAHPSREMKGPQLNLQGWLTMRENLIASENERLAQRRNAALEMDIPVLDDPQNQSVLIEEGEGYRPMTPSELDRRHRDRTGSSSSS